MRKQFISTIFILLLMPLMAFAYISPGKPLGFVSDFAGIVSDSDEQQLNTVLSDLKNTKGIELAVVTVKSLDNETVESFAVKLFEEWGIGEKSKDTGLLVLVAPNEKEVRIEVGYGIEGIITDIQSKNVIDKVIIPFFRNGDYSSGIKEGVNGLLAIINDDPTSSQFSQPRNQNSSSNKSIESVLIFIFIFINILSYIFSKTKSWWLGGVVGAVIGGIISIFIGFLYAGLLSIVGLTLIGLIIDYFASKGGPGRGHGGFWPMGGFGGGHGGGFGGFGGGSSGGGGASGRW